ncbi:hypothetical protein ACFE04_022028 [Oxalis oulophora]
MVTHEYGDPRLWTTAGTRMLMNEEIPVLDEYKDKFEQVDVTMIDKRAEMGSQLKKMIPMTLRQLLDEYDTLKQVNDIECDRSWCYQGCNFSTRSAERYEKFLLVGVNAFSIACSFRVNLDVVHGDSSAFFLLFESAGRLLYGLLDSIFQFMVYWVIGVLADHSESI